MANRRGRSIRFQVTDENTFERVTKSHLFRFEAEFIEELYEIIQLIRKEEVNYDISVGIEYLDIDIDDNTYWNYTNPILGGWAYSNISKDEFIDGIKEWLTHWNGMGVKFYEIGFIEKLTEEKLKENENYWNIEY